ncbi:MAG: hypothetical protein R6V33_05415, partial [Pelovirga sp.]
MIYAIQAPKLFLKNRKSLGVFIILILPLLSSFVDLKYSYKSFHVSQSLFSLFYLNIIFFIFLIYRKKTKFKLGLPSILLLLSSISFFLISEKNLIVVSALWVYILFLFFFQSTNLTKYSALILSYVALFSSVFSLILHLCAKFGILNLIPMGRVYGNYGQPNLLAALMLIGLFSYMQLLHSTRKKSAIYFIPAFFI